MLSGDDGSTPYKPIPVPFIEELPGDLNGNVIAFGLGTDSSGDSCIVMQTFDDEENLLSYFVLKLQHWEEFQNYFNKCFTSAVNNAIELSFPTAGNA